jgi:hypothetical protein
MFDDDAPILASDECDELQVDGLKTASVQQMCECVGKLNTEVLAEVRRSLKRQVWVRVIATCDVITGSLQGLVRPDDLVRLGDLSASEVGTLCRYHMGRYSKLNQIPDECMAVFKKKTASVCTLYVSALAHMARYFKEEGAGAAVSLREKPDGLVKLFVDEMLVKIEVRLQVCC